MNVNADPSKTPGAGDMPRRTRPSTKTHGGKLGELFDRHYRRLVRRLRSRVSSPRDAEDIAAEAFAKVLEVPEYASLNYQEAYLYRTALNLATNASTRGATQQRCESLICSELDEESPAAELSWIEQQDLELLRRAIDKLPDHWKWALTLRFWDECSYKEIARWFSNKGLSVAPWTLRRYVAAAVQSIRREIEAAEGLRKEGSR